MSTKFFSMQLSEIVNQGKLVSDEIIISLLSKRLESGEARGESGFILDGFPRTIRQAVSIFVECGEHEKHSGTLPLFFCAFSFYLFNHPLPFVS